MTIELLDLGAGSYRDLGRAHGDAWGEEACALFGIRWQLTRDSSPVTGLAALAREHIQVMEAYDSGLFQELQGISETSGLELWQLVILNHYTDFRDIRAEVAASAGGCSAIFAPLASGPAIAQTWDMHGSAEDHVRLLRVEPPDGPSVVTFTLTGCLGMTGLNAEGVAVCINNLTPGDARVGVLWPALVRRMLRERTALAAVQVLHDTELSSGHNYLIADDTHMFNVETTGGRKRVTADATTRPCYHTNHYLHDELTDIALPLHPASTSVDRFALLGAALELAPRSLEQLWSVLGSHEGHPRSICGHVGGSDPSASKTCGGVICDMSSRRMLAQQGCLNGAAWSEVRP